MRYNSMLVAFFVLFFAVAAFSQDLQLPTTGHHKGRVIMVEKIDQDGNAYLLDPVSGDAFKNAGQFHHWNWGWVGRIDQQQPVVGQQSDYLSPGHSPDYGFWLFQPLRDALVGNFIGERIGALMYTTFTTPPTGMLDFEPVQRLTKTTGVDYYEIPEERLTPGRHLMTLDQGKIGWSGLIVYPDEGETVPLVARVTINGKHWETVAPGMTVTLQWSFQKDPRLDAPTVIFNNFGAVATSGSLTFVVSQTTEVFFAIAAIDPDPKAAVKRFTTSDSAFVQVK